MDLDGLPDLVASRWGITRREAPERIAVMPGGMELLLGLVPVERSELALELMQEDPG